MLPMIKTDRGVVVQFTRPQLDLVKAACESYKLDVSRLLLKIRDLPTDAAAEMRAQVGELRNMADSIGKNLKLMDNAPKDGYELDISFVGDTMQL